jgi:cobalamin synthase
VWYTRLYDSMACWYRRWYSRDVYVRVMAATALTVLAFLNVISLLSIATLLGPTNWLVALNKARLVLPLWLLLWSVHLIYARHNASVHARQPREISSRIAVWYMVITALVFFPLFLWVLLTPRQI